MYNIHIKNIFYSYPGIVGKLTLHTLNYCEIPLECDVIECK